MSKTISPPGARPAGVPGPRAATRTRDKKSIAWGRVAAWGAMILLLFVSLFPFFWMLRTGLSSNAELVNGSQSLTPPGEPRAEWVAARERALPPGATAVNVKQRLGLASESEIAKPGADPSTPMNFF